MTTYGCPSGHTCQPTWHTNGQFNIDYSRADCTNYTVTAASNGNPSLSCPNLYGDSKYLVCPNTSTFKYGVTSCSAKCNCTYDTIRHRTSYQCNVGYICVGEWIPVTPCSSVPGDYICAESGISGASHTDCTGSTTSVCHPVCPLGESCTDIGFPPNAPYSVHPACGPGKGCWGPGGGASCPESMPHCAPGRGTSVVTGVGCRTPGYVCSVCREGEVEDNGNCESVCGKNAVCSDDGITGTQSAGCPTEEVCVGTCPPGYKCDSNSKSTGFETPHCSNYASCVPIVSCLNGLCDNIPIPGYISSECPSGEGCLPSDSCSLNDLPAKKCFAGSTTVDFSGACATGFGCESFTCATPGHVCLYNGATTGAGCPTNHVCGAACPIGYSCLVSFYFNETSPNCAAGHVCSLDPIANTNPCPSGMRCMNDNVAGTTYAGCPSEEVCGHECGHYMVNVAGLATGLIGTSASYGCIPMICGNGLACQPIGATYPNSSTPCQTMDDFNSLYAGSCYSTCEAGKICMQHSDPTMATTDRGCPLGHTCQLAPVIITTTTATNFGSGPLAHRYPNYPVSTIPQTVSGLPPQYTNAGSSLRYAARVVISAAYDTPPALIPNAAMMTGSFTVLPAVTRQPLPGDFVDGTIVSVRGQPITSFRPFAESPQASSIRDTNITCGTLLVSATSETVPASSIVVRNTITFCLGRKVPVPPTGGRASRSARRSRISPHGFSVYLPLLLVYTSYSHDLITSTQASRDSWRVSLGFVGFLVLAQGVFFDASEMVSRLIVALAGVAPQCFHPQMAKAISLKRYASPPSSQLCMSWTYTTMWPACR